MRQTTTVWPNRSTIKRSLAMFIMAFGLCFSLIAQERTVSGVVKDANDIGLPGVNVSVKGTTVGVVTDIEGKFSIKVPGNDAVLLITYVGYKSQELSVGENITFNVTLQEDVQQMDEVVVVGYGAMKKKLTTGANAHISGDAVSKRNNLRIEQSLQGATSGVMVAATSGQPGAGLKVRIRGVGTPGDASPLYIVDGVPVGDISYLDPNSVESMDILKDAASGAIYGVRAANGVVLITTKKGKSGQMNISYDGYYGVQNAPKRIDLLNAEEYMNYMNEANFNAKKGYKYPSDENGKVLQSVLDTVPDTDWQDYLFTENSPVQSHAININGGNDISTFSINANYMKQNGIIGDEDMSYYQRISAGINSEHKIYKDIVVVGENLTFSNKKSKGVGVGNIYDNSIRGFLSATPIFSPLDASNADGYGRSWIPEESNPYAAMHYFNQNISRNNKLVSDIYLQIEPIKNLKFKSDFGIDLSFDEYNKYTPAYYLSTLSSAVRSTTEQNMNRHFTYNWENFITYSFAIGKHDFTALVGNTVNEYSRFYVRGTKQDLIIEDFDHAILDNAIYDSTITVNGLKEEDAILSYFGRLNYNYDEKYLFAATIRRDGSTRFGKDNRWGNFISFSGGWVVTQEDFFKFGWLDYFKVRASWGQNGNDKIEKFAYLSLIDFADKNYYFGANESKSIGAAPAKVENSKLQWEEAEQTNIGFDSRFLKDFSLAFDWYEKKQNGWLITQPVPTLMGILNTTEYPIVNGGDVKNTGIEIALGYQKSLGEFNFSLNANFTKNKNEVIDIPNEEKVIHGQTNVLSNGFEEMYRAEPGLPMGYFYGYKTDGIFQNVDEVNAHKGVDSLGNPILNAKGTQVLIQSSAVPGDVRFIDTNKDGKINSEDKTMIGNPHPDFSYGLTLNADYKGFDFSMVLQGVYGNDIVYGARSADNSFGNYSSDILERWHGEGTSNRMPRAYFGKDPNQNWFKFSDLYIYDGSYMKIRNVSFGYDFAKNVIRSPFKQLRVYFSVLNAFTFSDYKGYDPEVGYGDTSVSSENMSTGIDLGTYPIPRQYMVGINCKF